jgi:HK97 family phage major capsid protein
MSRLMNTLEHQRSELEAEEATIAEQAGAAGGLDDAQRSRLAEIATSLERVEGDISAEQARVARGRTETATAVLDRDTREGAITSLGAFGDAPRSFGEHFADSAGWRNYVAQVAPDGFSEGARIESPKVSVPAAFLPRPGSGKMGLVTSGATSGGAMYVPDQSGIFDPGTFQRDLTIRDVITTGTTDSSVVEYVRVTGYTNNAAPVAEADDVLHTDTTGLKPWSDLTLERVAEVVKSIAHGVPATTRALSDAGQLRTIIDTFLRYGLQEELEDQIVSGSGTGEDLRGILDYVGDGLGEQAYTTDLLTTTRKARTKVRVGGKARASFYLFHPNDWERIDLEMTLGGGGSNYRQAGELTMPRLWGLPVVESEGVPEGTGIVGDGRMAVLWDRQQTTIQASSGYMNFFMKNLVAVLAEMRAAFGVIRPEAFVAIDLSAS